MYFKTWNKTGDFLLTFDHGYLTVFDDYKMRGNCIEIRPELVPLCAFITRNFSINFIVRGLFYIFPRFDG